MLAGRFYKGRRGAYSDLSILPSAKMGKYDEAMIWSLRLWIDYRLVFSAFAMEYRSCRPTLSFADIR